jgi:hypothetical protein
VARVMNSLPHVQCTWARVYVGWILAFIVLSF